jgi:hypothetical protein
MPKKNCNLIILLTIPINDSSRRLTIFRHKRALKIEMTHRSETPRLDTPKRFIIKIKHHRFTAI